MLKIIEFNTITLYIDRPYLYFICENGMKAKYDFIIDRYVTNTFSDIGNIYLDGWFENNVEQVKQLRNGVLPENIEFLGPV